MSQEIDLHYRTADGNQRSVRARIGDSVMETAVQHDIDEIVAECGGCLICATCHVYLSDETAALFDEPDDAELEMLEDTAAERRPNSRLSCQLPVKAEMDGHVIEMPEQQ